MRTFRKCVIAAAIVLLASSAAAQQLERAETSDYVVPLAGLADSGPKHLTLCADPWVKMVPDGSEAWAATWYKEAWHCIPRDYSCFREGETGDGYGCQRGQLTGLVVTADTGDLGAQGARVPEQCIELYQAAGWESVLVNKTAQEIVDQGNAGLDILTSASRARLQEEYLDLVEKVSQLLERKMVFDVALTKAVECSTSDSHG